MTDDELRVLQNIDILMVPVGGGRVMDAKIAADVISQVEPRVVIPMTYDLPGIKEKFAGVDVFCKEMGMGTCEELNKYKVTRKDLPEEDMRIVVLTR